MSEQPAIVRLKEALIAELTDQVEHGTRVVNKDGEVEKISTPANVLAVAAKVVKDFSQEAEVDPSITRLDEITAAYKLRKAAPSAQPAVSH